MLRELELTCCILKQETSRHLEEPGVDLSGGNSGYVTSSLQLVFWGRFRSTERDMPQGYSQAFVMSYTSPGRQDTEK